MIDMGTLVSQRSPRIALNDFKRSSSRSLIPQALWSQKGAIKTFIKLRN